MYNSFITCWLNNLEADHKIINIYTSVMSYLILTIMWKELNIN